MASYSQRGKKGIAVEHERDERRNIEITYLVFVSDSLFFSALS